MEKPLADDFAREPIIPDSASMIVRQPFLLERELKGGENRQSEFGYGRYGNRIHSNLLGCWIGDKPAGDRTDCQFSLDLPFDIKIQRNQDHMSRKTK